MGPKEHKLLFFSAIPGVFPTKEFISVAPQTKANALNLTDHWFSYAPSDGSDHNLIIIFLKITEKAIEKKTCHQL